MTKWSFVSYMDSNAVIHDVVFISHLFGHNFGNNCLLSNRLSPASDYILLKSSLGSYVDSNAVIHDFVLIGHLFSHNFGNNCLLNDRLSPAGDYILLKSHLRVLLYYPLLVSSCQMSKKRFLSTSFTSPPTRISL